MFMGRFYLPRGLPREGREERVSNGGNRKLLFLFYNFERFYYLFTTRHVTVLHIFHTP